MPAGFSTDDSLSAGPRSYLEGKPNTIAVTAPRFSFSYSSSAGYIIGSASHSTTKKDFFLNVEGTENQANVEDFQSLKFFQKESGEGEDKKSEYLLSVKAAGADAVAGQLMLKATDSKGDHSGDYHWFLVCDLPNGSILALRRPICTLSQ